MNARDVAELVEFLEQHGLELYVDGGWAVDALLGETDRGSASSGPLYGLEKNS